ncbi:MAG: transposase [Ruminococcaceae bacterium]|nr:transposase [Oscillospiraceae bacterium]
MNQDRLFRILLLITTPKLAERASKFLQTESIPIHYMTNAVGTAPNDILDILGLGTPDRMILISMMPKTSADKMLRKLQAELRFSIPGNGIAFTLPLSGANCHLLKILGQIDEADAASSERKDGLTMAEIKRVMIAAAVNHGYSEEVMIAAREAGAGGGTVIHGRGVGEKDTLNVWGISVQEEREIVLIVADTEHKLGIMRAISEACGMNSDANGIVLSMPIDNAIGLGIDE